MKTKLSLLAFLAGFLLLMSAPGYSESNNLEDNEEFTSEELESFSKTKTSFKDHELTEEEAFTQPVSSSESEILPEDSTTEETPIEPETPVEIPSEDF